MRQILFLVLVLSTFNVYAQKKDPKNFAACITAEDLKKHLFTVAGPEMEGRETATEGQRKAAAYLESEFRKLGLLPGNENSYQHYFDVFQDSLTSARVEVNGKGFELDKDFNPVIANNLDATLRFSEVIVAGSTSADSLKNMNLAGRLVMIFSSAPTGRGRQAGGLFQVLMNKGIAGLLLVQDNYPRKESTRKGNQSANMFRRNLPVQQYLISEDIANHIIGSNYDKVRSDSGGIHIIPSNILLETSKQTLKMQSSNVMAMIPGTKQKDEYLFITAHYDHLGKRNDSVVYYGADDDGSGTVSLIEIAEAFMKAAKAGKGPGRNIVLMAVSGEEKGLWGSSFYADNPVYPLEKTTANLNIDMIGRIDPSRKYGDSLNYVYVIGDDKMSSELRPLSESVNKKYLGMELDYKFNGNDPQRFFYRSDHYNFAKKGVPIIFYFNGTHADYHRPTDTPDKINYPLLAKRARLVFLTAWEMANRDGLIKRDIPLETNVFTR